MNSGTAKMTSDANKADTVSEVGGDDRRFAMIPITDLTPAQRAVVDDIREGARAGVGAESLKSAAAPVGGPFNVWLRNADLADHLQKLGGHVRFKSSLPARLNELAILVTARHWSAQYEWFAHHKLALAAGLDPRVAEDIAQGRRPANMQADEAAVYDFSHELHSLRKVGDAAYKAALAHFGETGVVDLIAVNGYYTIVSMTLNVDGTPLPGGAAPPLAPLG